eukprot:Pompholyxophrys_punicea_v1_NODE_836_length_1229_cov_1.688245.p1 type:complete len:150 gc:universal NODE_836_length_1229_cov_1.688245:726-277(-)
MLHTSNKHAPPALKQFEFGLVRPEHARTHARTRAHFATVQFACSWAHKRHFRTHVVFSQQPFLGSNATLQTHFVQPSRDCHYRDWSFSSGIQLSHELRCSCEAVALAANNQVLIFLCCRFPLPPWPTAIQARTSFAIFRDIISNSRYTQ